VDRAASADPVFADFANREQLSALLQPLIEQKRWTLDEDRAGVAKTYYFKTYTKCLVRSLPVFNVVSFQYDT
jgi:hypothetical protein